MGVFENRDWRGDIGTNREGSGKIIALFENSKWMGVIGTYG